MTRAEILDALSGYTFPPVSQVGIKTWQRLHDSMAAELGKTCATCKWFMKTRVTSTNDPDGLSGVAFCKQLHVAVPRDGSGFCHQWKDGAR